VILPQKPVHIRQQVPNKDHHGAPQLLPIKGKLDAILLLMTQHAMDDRHALAARHSNMSVRVAHTNPHKPLTHLNKSSGHDRRKLLNTKSIITSSKYTATGTGAPPSPEGVGLR
jgi:hypothetical protein